jgi:hypothetical protein
LPGAGGMGHFLAEESCGRLPAGVGRLPLANAWCVPREVGVVHGGVFINYRGEDSHSYGALLHAELSRRFGLESVFLDSASIPAGADFVEQLLGRVRQAAVVLAVIGSRWLAAAGPGGRRRIDDPADWIRRELVEAFAAGVRVIPVLTDGADHSPLALAHTELTEVLIARIDGDGAVTMGPGHRHPRLAEWQGSLDLGTLFAAGVLS